MNKSILWLIGLLFVTSLSIVSCSETDGTEDPYANWEERNQRYIDSIATVAEANRGNGEGQWKIIRSYKLPSLGLNETGKIIDNVYCKIQKVGDGTESPIATDTVAVNYRGQLFLLIRFTTTFVITSFSSVRLSAIISVRATSVLLSKRREPSAR